MRFSSQLSPNSTSVIVSNNKKCPQVDSSLSVLFRNWLGRQRMWRNAQWGGKTAWVFLFPPLSLPPSPAKQDSGTKLLCRFLIKLSATGICRHRHWVWHSLSLPKLLWNHGDQHRDYDNDWNMSLCVSLRSLMFKLWNQTAAGVTVVNAVPWNPAVSLTGWVL